MEAPGWSSLSQYNHNRSFLHLTPSAQRYRVSVGSSICWSLLTLSRCCMTKRSEWWRSASGNKFTISSPSGSMDHHMATFKTLPPSSILRGSFLISLRVKSLLCLLRCWKISDLGPTAPALIKSRGQWQHNNTTTT